MKKIIILIILLTGFFTINSIELFAEENEIIPFHPDPSLVTEWDISVQGYILQEVVFDTPILKVIIPDGTGDIVLSFIEVYSTVVNESIIWIISEQDIYTQVELEFTDTYASTLWLGGRQSVEPIMQIYSFSMDEYSQIEYIYLYSDSFFNIVNYTNIYSYNFEYELNQEYQSGYDDGYGDGFDDGWGEDEPFLTTNQIILLVVSLIMYILAIFMSVLTNNRLLIAFSGLLWVIPIIIIDNFIIRVFSAIVILVSFMILTKGDKEEYYE